LTIENNIVGLPQTLSAGDETLAIPQHGRMRKWPTNVTSGQFSRAIRARIK
jgi:hypothetical protein